MKTKKSRKPSKTKTKKLKNKKVKTFPDLCSQRNAWDTPTFYVVDM